ncbi:VOC family protein [Aureimonas flava]|uniref:VOC family protein n=1 Tax=Aureimonas flava TaxID=2320271 RepID=A0A3A1WJC5_9HYPH|nr:VOC family protein [Aureimonas flava]RIX98769.1 VOC family protein [Aureimonas flava]
MDTLRPCLWFDGNAREAVDFYVSLLPGSRIDAVVPAPRGTPGRAEGDVLMIEFTLMGQPYSALNGGPDFRFTPAVSLVVPCRDQAEVDRLWDALADGGAPLDCGWVNDRFGLSWQVVPDRLLQMLRSAEREPRQRAFEAMMGMVKLDLAALEAAWAGQSPSSS